MRAVLVGIFVMLLLIAAAVVRISPSTCAEDGTVVCAECECGVVHDATFARADEGSGEPVHYLANAYNNELEVLATSTATAPGKVSVLKCPHVISGSACSCHRHGNLIEVAVFDVGVQA